MIMSPPEFNATNGAGSPSLVPMAPNMATMLAALKDIPFSCANDTIHQDQRSTTDRSEALATLVSVLVEQAKHDGFRLITINTEPKRVIMACNRQGKPPRSHGGSPSDTTIAAVSPITTASPSDDDAKKRSGRWGTSIRCQCRMRVNINYHTKLNAWRVTSFETKHNHAYGTVTANVDWPAVEGSGYRVSAEQTHRAIQQYMSMNTAPPRLTLTVNGTTPGTSPSASSSSPAESTDNDAAMVLSSLSKSSTMSSFEAAGGSPPAYNHTSPNHLQVLREQPQPNINRPAPPRIIVVRRPSIDNESSTRPMSAGGVLQQHDHHANHSPSAPAIAALSQAAASMAVASSPSPMMVSGPSLDTLRGLASTAIEIDRYAMLHNQFKKLIAVACKKRENTEDVLNGIGKLMEHVCGGGSNDDDSLLTPSSKKRRLESSDERAIPVIELPALEAPPKLPTAAQQSDRMHPASPVPDMRARSERAL